MAKAKSSEEENHQALQKDVPLLCAIIMFAHLFFIPTDLAFPQANFTFMLYYRLLATVLYLLLLLLSLTPWGKKKQSTIGLAMLSITLCGISVSNLTAMTGGSSSPYWTMIILTFFGGTLILHLSVLQAAISYGIILVYHFSNLLFFLKDNPYTPEFITSFFGLSLSYLVSMAGNWYMRSLEKSIWERNNTIERQTAELNHQLQLASEIQQSFLPQPLKDARVEISYLYLPCLSIGGDFLDYRMLTPQIIGLFLCDVSGHGVPAALLSSMVKISLTKWPLYVEDPAGLMTYLYYEIGDKLGKNFLTAIAVHLNLLEGKAIIASAGHPGAILRHQDGTIAEINPPGTMIFELAEPKCQNLTFYIQPGEVLCLYTDGIVEAHNPQGEMYSEERFFDFLSRHGSSIRHIGTQLLEELDQFTTRGTSSFLDDLSLLAVKLHSAPANLAVSEISTSQKPA